LSNQLSFQLEAWAGQLQQRKELQDSLSSPREVNHFFTFNDKKSAGEACKTLMELNFDVTVSKRGLFNVEVSATHVSDLKDETIKALLKQMVRISENHSGVYDGFGAGLGG
jgi:regulator of RNase E activity RraB